ncbi:transcriptional regulator NrdR [Candidatus Collierbacteria bacterium RIFCSPLOWO2_01_FULL_50_23]|uniref:Transcriptional repressor NrdR n=2 Tax=Candidatus Collieribacteriota TaxID=1752725 RepID=A0A1F5EW43_9BACT|nr:MAG: transcriptional regulator NrdR [Candidatus Collierbacteria bacterium RIFCSPHIGHO2_01_FULL_50_25]OGD71602.1 MAG: transcriptional regulator NrdR [Candidatus Collierbacteria bacterium RIFCSPHIGHO2_02_FULL_49_10]OGD73884.1 MAG: transcriptional regulator NrdR [Candidatus Collierbacteria bacterium RIFCSPLOWO2_01_FULL_50_23]
MNCPYCENKDTAVLESRVLPLGEGMRRRRECKKCTKRFTTYEKVVNLDLKVVKKSGGIEDFDREKIVKGIKKACWKRPVTEEQMTDLVDDLELKLLNRMTTNVPSCDIGKMILSRLKKLDDVAYLRFASVYLEFASAADFAKLITSLAN